MDSPPVREVACLLDLVGVHPPDPLEAFPQVREVGCLQVPEADSQPAQAAGYLQVQVEVFQPVREVVSPQVQVEGCRVDLAAACRRALLHT